MLCGAPLFGYSMLVFAEVMVKQIVVSFNWQKLEGLWLKGNHEIAPDFGVGLKVALQLPDELQSADRLTFDFVDGSFVVAAN
jgi:hypothetical protein